MNTVVTSKEAILAVCRGIVSETGLSSLNMRAVAEGCHVALGSLYNYFPSKEDMLLATVESVWRDIFRPTGVGGAGLSFPDYVAWMFGRVLRSAVDYPGFFSAHSLRFTGTGKGRARDTMDRYFSGVRREMADALHRDPAVRKDAFSPAFTESDLIDFVLTGLLALLVTERRDCRPLTELIRRAIY